MQIILYLEVVVTVDFLSVITTTSIYKNREKLLNISLQWTVLQLLIINLRDHELRRERLDMDFVE